MVNRDEHLARVSADGNDLEPEGACRRSMKEAKEALLSSIAGHWGIGREELTNAPRGAKGHTLAYTRYSTLHQKEASTARQVEKLQFTCRQWEVTLRPSEIYSDEGRSGSEIAGREKLDELLQRCRGGGIARVVVASMDRLSRDLGDMVWLWKELARLNVELYCAEFGTMDEMKIVLVGLMASQHRRAIVANTTWGRENMVTEGRVPTGRCFGYAAVVGTPGLLRIDEDQARLVAQIYQMRAAGLSKRDICRCLNENGHLSPGGKRWGDSSIVTILKNPLYKGWIVFNRRKRIKSQAGERSYVFRPQTEWKLAHVPHLAIIPDSLWDDVQAIEGANRRRPPAQMKQRAPYLLSGRLKCASCGGNMCSQGGGESKQIRFGCTAHARLEACSNNDTFIYAKIEEAVIHCIRDFLDRPDFQSIYAVSLVKELSEIEEKALGNRLALRSRLDCLNRELLATFDSDRTEGFTARTIRAIREGLESKVADAEDALASLPDSVPDSERVQDRIADVREALTVFAAEHPFQISDEAARILAAALRSLVQRVEVRRCHGEYSTFEVEIYLSFGPLFGALPPTVNLAAQNGIVLKRRSEFKHWKQDHSKIERQERERAVDLGNDAVPDAVWESVAQFCQGAVIMRAPAPLNNPRTAFQAMLCAARSKYSWHSVPAQHGSGIELQKIVRSIVSAGEWEKIVAILQRIAPELLVGVDVTRWDYFRSPRSTRPATEPVRTQRSL